MISKNDEMIDSGREPEKLDHRLPEGILSVWRQTTYITTFILLLISVGVGTILYLNEISLWWVMIGIGIAVIDFTISLLVIPFRWKRWHFEVRQQEIEIEEGVIFTKRTLIPMIRIQHVQTSQGPLLKKKKLMALSISTAASTHTIPAIREDESEEIREHILKLVKAAREDV